MKTMSITSMTSTSGMTLISDSDVATRGPRRCRRPDPPWLLAGCTLGTAQRSYEKLRSVMFRNSSEKSSIAPASSFIFCVKWL